MLLTPINKILAYLKDACGYVCLICVENFFKDIQVFFLVVKEKPIFVYSLISIFFIMCMHYKNALFV